MTFRAVIVGAGPSGFYSADQLLDAGFEVDLLDALPTPYGLVRSGVAPDQPKIKSVARVFEKTALREGFRFFGGVQLGRDVRREDLRERYHVIVYAIGTPDDRRLGVPGEDRPGSHSATRFVAWYNGHPDAADDNFDLGVDRAVVIGNGNVAIDVARMLVLDPEELAPTDTADHAINALRASTVSEVVLLGRRGPAQASFTLPELGELANLRRAGVVINAADLELDDLSRAWLDKRADAACARKLELLSTYAADGPKRGSHRIVLRFLRSPVEIIGEGPSGRVRGVRVAVNRLEAGTGGHLAAVAGPEEETIDCGLVLRAVGYRGRPVAGLPFDERRGVIHNAGGRVTDATAKPFRGEYVVGWIKRGPSGVIGTNKKDAADTVARVREDLAAGQLNEAPGTDAGALQAWLMSRAERVVSWDGWHTIDLHETAHGERSGRPRVKLVTLPELFAIGRRDRTDALDRAAIR